MAKYNIFYNIYIKILILFVILCIIIILVFYTNVYDVIGHYNITLRDIKLIKLIADFIEMFYKLITFSLFQCK